MSRIEGVAIGYSWHCPKCLDGEAADYEFFFRREPPRQCCWCGSKRITQVREHIRLDNTAEFRERLATSLSTKMSVHGGAAIPYALVRMALDAVLGEVTE